MKSWVPAGVMFLVAGVLEVMFLALSLVGTLMGGVLTGLAVAGEMRGEDAIIGPIVLISYGLWLACTIVAGPVHLVAGAAFVTGRKSRPLLWAATVVSVLPLATVYCAPFAIGAGVLGLVTALSTPEAGDSLA